MADVTDVVQKQLEAYNSHDLEAFVSAYAPDVTVTSGEGRTLMTGREEIREQYARLFEGHRELRAEVPNRICVGSWVVDEERVHVDGQQMEALMAYEVTDGLIQRVVMLGSP